MVPITPAAHPAIISCKLYITNQIITHNRAYSKVKLVDLSWFDDDSSPLTRILRRLWDEFACRPGPGHCLENGRFSKFTKQ